MKTRNTMNYSLASEIDLLRSIIMAGVGEILVLKKYTTRLTSTCIKCRSLEDKFKKPMKMADIHRVLDCTPIGKAKMLKGRVHIVKVGPSDTESRMRSKSQRVRARYSSLTSSASISVIWKYKPEQSPFRFTRRFLFQLQSRDRNKSRHHRKVY